MSQALIPELPRPYGDGCVSDLPQQSLAARKGPAFPLPCPRVPVSRVDRVKHPLLKPDAKIAPLLSDRLTLARCPACLLVPLTALVGAIYHRQRLGISPGRFMGFRQNLAGIMSPACEWFRVVSLLKCSTNIRSCQKTSRSEFAWLPCVSA